MNKIYLYRVSKSSGDAPGIAYDEDGNQISFHVSSSYEFFREDMRRGGHLQRYHERYPEGYDLVEVIGVEELQKVVPNISVAPLVNVDAPEEYQKSRGPSPEVNDTARHMANALHDIVRARFGEDVGFLLMLFEFGPDGFVVYQSNAERQSMIAKLEEFLEQLRD